MSMVMAASSSPRNWVYDVFPSFSGADVRVTFLSHFLKELDRKLIVSFKDNEIERSQSLAPELTQAIKDSRIAVVVFSKNYASSSWCLNELLEIVKCKKDFGQMVIPVFYGLDPSHVRKQTGEFGEIFEETCHNKEDELKLRWKEALTDVANILGYHSMTWGNEAKMIEEIANDVLNKILSTTSKEYEDHFVGMKDHIAKMSVLLDLEFEEVKMIGIWGSSGIGKTTIARALFNRLSRHFQGSVFIDRAFVSRSMQIYCRANPDDYSMKLDLQRNFLSEILGKRDIQINHLGAVGGRLNHQKVLIVIDDLDDQVVLDALVGGDEWFGCGSRIIVVTKDKHFLRSHGIHHIYEVCLPSEELALEMFSRSAFKQNSPPDGFMEVASKVVRCAGSLPLGLTVLGSLLRGREKQDWMDMLPSLLNRLNGKVERTLRVSYEGLNNKKDEAIFRHIACFFDGEKINDIKQLLADSNLDVTIGLKNLVDKSLIRLDNLVDKSNERWNYVEMHSLLQEMGKEIVRTQSNEPGEREFLMDAKDICDVLEDSTGTKTVLGISLLMDEIDELHLNESSFKGMRNLLFLQIYTREWDCRVRLPERFDYFPPKLRLLCWKNCPLRCLPSNIHLENLVKLQMWGSQLKKLWEGVQPLPKLKHMDLSYSKNLKEIPDLSMTTNLETLYFSGCLSLVELPSSIQYLNKLTELEMSHCYKLETLPTGINLQSLDRLYLWKCSRLKTFPDISRNISYLDLGGTGIEEVPWWIEKFSRLGTLEMNDCKNLQRVSLNLLKLKHLVEVDFERNNEIPDLSMATNLETLSLSWCESLVELPSSIQYLNKLAELEMSHCYKLETLPTGINLKSLNRLNLSGCSRLKTFPDISRNISYLGLSETGIEEVPWWIEKFSRLGTLEMNDCKNLQRVSLNLLKLKHLVEVDFGNCGALTEARFNDSPSEVAMGTDNILSNLRVHADEASSSLPHDDFSLVKLYFVNCFNFDPKALIQQQIFFMQLIIPGEEVPSYFTHRTSGSSLNNIPLCQTSLSQRFFRFRVCTVVDVEEFSSYEIQVCCRFIDRHGNHFDYTHNTGRFTIYGSGGHLVIIDCCSPLAEQLNYDHVDIQFHLTVKYGDEGKLKGCGIQLFEEDLHVNPNILLHVCEDLEECGDVTVERSESRNPKRIKYN